MSDLFKDHRPELSDDEDRRLWQRVRTIPADASGEAVPRAPWWTRLLALPAVRYGAPAFAVLLVAVVWVVERRPEPPARVAAIRAANELDPRASAPAAPGNAPSPMAQAPTAANRVRSTITDGTVGRQPAQAPRSKDQPAGRAAGGPVLERAVTLRAIPAPTPAPPAKEAQKFADAPATPAREEAAAKIATRAPAPAPAAAPSITSWGAPGSRSRDSGRATSQTLADERATAPLAAGSPLSPAELGRHALVTEVADVADLGPLTATVSPPPGDFGLSAGESIALRLSAGGSLVSVVRAPGIPFGSAPARVQAAALAALLERALQDLAGTPRARLEALRDAALGIDAAASGQGRIRLLGAIDGALGVAPAR